MTENKLGDKSGDKLGNQAEAKALGDLELYVHIPFCVRKCKYCDFLSAPASKQVQNAYMEALLSELRGRAVSDRRVVSVFVGGGTPSVVDAERICDVMETIKSHYILKEDAEISMEVNPGTVTTNSLERYRAAGVNRLSIGCQSCHDAELSHIGRIHDHQTFLDTYDRARAAGFDNINVDLMSGLPGQSLESWEETLRIIVSLNPPPEHISAYSLIVEEGTPFYEMWQRGELVLPNEDMEREMYWRTADILKGCGYEHYEISNYARKGYQCRHNVGYWTRRDYLGFGVGAASLYDNVRYSNTDDLTAYIGKPLKGCTQVQELSREEQMEEEMFLGLRLSHGVSGERFRELFDVSVREVYGEQIRESVKEGLLEDNGERLVLTGKGVDLANYVMAKFLF
ncbi:MAG: radical SAM family heme chaperone HemW [Butyrivibrio sp.]|nr:radical SAM family heme chaperone HemW [Muribaculum sp.]MCM1552979.1 radical SAM family heme chaperone HemW [Butyrivibrio sp.]